MVKSQFSECAATGDRVLCRGNCLPGRCFRRRISPFRVLTRNLTAGMDRPGESAEQVKKPGCRLVGTVFGRDRNTGSVSLDGRTDSYGKASARFPELEERFAEFFLIGRLLSIGLAFLDGLVLVQPWYGTMSLK